MTKKVSQKHKVPGTGRSVRRMGWMGRALVAERDRSAKLERELARERGRVTDLQDDVESLSKTLEVISRVTWVRRFTGKRRQ